MADYYDYYYRTAVNGPLYASWAYGATTQVRETSSGIAGVDMPPAGALHQFRVELLSGDLPILNPGTEYLGFLPMSPKYPRTAPSNYPYQTYGALKAQIDFFAAGSRVKKAIGEIDQAALLGSPTVRFQLAKMAWANVPDGRCAAWWILAGIISEPDTQEIAVLDYVRATMPLKLKNGTFAVPLGSEETSKLPAWTGNTKINEFCQLYTLAWATFGA